MRTDRLEASGLQPQRFEGNDRFELRRLLGIGGMGEVFEAFDRTLGTAVAIKRLPQMNADALFHFKREFRVIADLSHPNLIQLGGLYSHHGQWFFTMELLHGVDLMRWVRRTPAVSPPEHKTQPDLGEGRSSRADAETGGVDEERLRSAFGQLVDVLSWLHGLGRVHLDLKPPNVLVTEDGRLVLLDFGIAADLGAGDRPTPAGTFAYAAPEQLAGGEITTAADQYALGVLLYEALTGRLPFSGSAADLLHAKQHALVVQPSVLVQDAPTDLDRVCLSLLSAEPGARPSSRSLALDLGRSRVGAGPASLPFSGRDTELAVLDRCLSDACAGRPRVALVVGEGGIGKSALTRHFVRRVALARSDCLVLSSICHEQESVPYKAFDELMDRVGLVLADLPSATIGTLSSEARALLSRAFPVLAARCPSDDVAAERLADPHELRVRLRQSLVALFRWLAREAPLVVLVEDLHWADDDSVELLEGLVSGLDGSPILLVLTQRPDAKTPRLPADAVRIELAGLSLATSEALVAGLVRGATEEARGVIATAVRESGGNPLLLDALVRHALEHGQQLTGRLEDAIGARVAALPERARELLALVATGSGTVSQRVIARALVSSEPVALGRLVALLRQERLLRTRGNLPGDTLDTYHDRIRAAVLGAQPESDFRRDHARLASALELEPAGLVDRETLAQHWIGAGEPDRARGYVVEAAESSMTALAFERAARLFSLARRLFLDEPATAGTLSHRLGDALSAMGRGSDAAAAYLDARATAAPAAQLLLERLAANALVRSGNFDRGAELLDRALSAVGEPVSRSRGMILLRFLLERARIRLRPLEKVPPHAMKEPTSRLEVLWTASTGLSFVDPLRAAFYQARLIRHALAEGSAAWRARGLALEAAFRALVGGRIAQQIPRLLEHATVLGNGEPHPSGFIALATACAALSEGRWSAAEAAAMRAETLLRGHCAGVEWELATAQVARLWILLPSGRVRDMSILTERMLVEAGERGDLHLALCARLGACGLPWLAQDSPEEARRQADLAMTLLRDAFYRHEHLHVMVVRVHADLYAGNVERAFDLLEHDWPLMKRAYLPQMQMTRINATWMRGRIALGVSRGGARKGARAIAEDAAARLEREPHAWARALSQMLRAGLLLDAGAPCDRDLRQAATALRATGQDFYAYPLERRQAELAGDPARVAALDGEFRALGFSQPARMAFMLLPIATS